MDVLLYWRSQYGAVLRTIQCLQITGHQTPWDSGGNEAGTLWEKHGIKNKTQDEEL